MSTTARSCTYLIAAKRHAGGEAVASFAAAKRERRIPAFEYMTR